VYIVTVTSFSSFPFGFIPENVAIVADEHGEMLYPGITQTEKRYSGKWSANKLADCCWSHIRKKSTGENQRQKSDMRDTNWCV
jgi:hypothetical protein